jgi:spore germination protein KA
MDRNSTGISSPGHRASAPRRFDMLAAFEVVQECQRLTVKLDAWLESLGQGGSPPQTDAYVPDMALVHRRIKKEMGESPDVVMRWVAVPSLKGKQALVVYVDGMMDSQMLDQDVLGPLQQTTTPPDTWNTNTLRTGDVQAVRDWSTLLRNLASGHTIICVPGFDAAWSVDTAKFKQRGIDRPETELTVRGPMEAFNEVIWTQMSQLRRRFPTPNLQFHQVRIGTQQGPVVVVYLRGITNPNLVRTVIRRLEQVKLEARPNATIVAGLIRDYPRSIFPTIRSTERVEVAAWHLAEGKVVILVDGDPFVLIAPAPLADFYRTAMDYSGAWQDASFVRFVRFAGWALGVYLPAFYIAMTDINSNVLPTGLLIVIEGSRAGLPVHPLSEVLLMIFTIEILREAALRLPKVLATTIGTVGAIVVGTPIVALGTPTAPGRARASPTTCPYA